MHKRHLLWIVPLAILVFAFFPNVFAYEEAEWEHPFPGYWTSTYEETAFGRVIHEELYRGFLARFYRARHCSEPLPPEPSYCQPQWEVGLGGLMTIEAAKWDSEWLVNLHVGRDDRYSLVAQHVFFGPPNQPSAAPVSDTYLVNWYNWPRYMQGTYSCRGFFLVNRLDRQSGWRLIWRCPETEDLL
jgi:hypothetical protein